MANTELHKYTVQEKLNKMDIDVISLTPTVQDDDTDAANDLIFDSTEIPNAVAVNGGSCILQSVSVFHKAAETVVLDLVFYQVIQDLGVAGAALTWGGSSETTNADNAVLLGHVQISNWCDLVDVKLATKTNIGLALKAASDTKSIYCAAIARGAATGNHDADSGNIQLRLGLIKD